MADYFFSYARDDSDFVLKLAKDLRAGGASLWLDQLDIKPGQRWDSAVEEALQRAKGMILILSPDSVASNNVMDEVSYALEEGKLVVPVFDRECNIPFRLRRVQYINFTTDYSQGLAQLLMVLDVKKPPETEEAAQPEPQAAEAPAATTPAPSPQQPAATAPPPEPEPQATEAPAEAPPTATPAPSPQPPVTAPPPEPEPQPVEQPAAATPAPSPQQPPVTAPPPEPEPQAIKAPVEAPPAATPTPAKTTWRERRIGALIVGVVWAVIGAFFNTLVGSADDLIVVTAWMGVAGAIAGSISGTHRKVLVVTIAVAVVGFILMGAVNGYDRIDAIWGPMIGVILGAIIGVILKKKKGWT